jgi:hypothetical protein
VNKTELLVEVHVWRSVDSRANPTVELRVEDTTSGELLALVKMDAGQWLQLTNGQSMRLLGEYSPHLERVGRSMVWREEAVPRQVTGYIGAEGNARQWAKNRAQPGETPEVRNTTAGWVAIYRSWPVVSDT